MRSIKLKLIHLEQKNMKLVSKFSKNVIYPLLLYFNVIY